MGVTFWNSFYGTIGCLLLTDTWGHFFGAFFVMEAILMTIEYAGGLHAAPSRQAVRVKSQKATWV